MVQANELTEAGWRTIPKWEDYLISCSGEVFSKRRNKIMRVYRANIKAYPSVCLSCKGFEKTYSIHKLVALAFLANPDNKIAVNHKDGNKHNNHVSNLEWVTFSENQIHAIETGLATVPNLGFGENHPSAKLTDVDVQMIRVLLKHGEFTQKQIAKRFNIHEVHVSAIKLNKTRIQ